MFSTGSPMSSFRAMRYFALSSHRKALFSGSRSSLGVAHGQIRCRHIVLPVTISREAVR